MEFTILLSESPRIYWQYVNPKPRCAIYKPPHLLQTRDRLLLQRFLQDPICLRSHNNPSNPIKDTNGAFYGVSEIATPL